MTENKCSYFFHVIQKKNGEREKKNVGQNSLIFLSLTFRNEWEKNEGNIREEENRNHTNIPHSIR